MKKVLLTICLVGLFVSVQGCATVFSGTSKTVNISSNPPKADFTLAKIKGWNNTRTVIEMGQTPQNVTIQRRGNYVVTFDKEGYQSKTTRIKTTTNGWMYLDIALLSPGAIIIDLITGACDDPHNVGVRLEPINKY